ncbi:MAG: penicillin-binding transpeptidase domain-containing protein [Rikenellaceae bacterium]
MPTTPQNDIKSDIIKRVRVLYVLFILVGSIIFLRLIWVQVFSSEVAFNAERLEGRIFQHQDIKAHRGSILSRDSEPLATSIFRYQVEMDFGSEGFDSLKTYYEQSDSLAELLSKYFKDRSEAQYRKMFREQRAKKYKLTYKKDSLVARSEGWWGRTWDRLRGEEFKTMKVYDTLRDHTPVAILPRDIDYTEWQTLRKFPILNWNMGMTYNLTMRDERVYPQEGLGGRIIGKLQGDRGGDYGIEMVMSEALAGRDGKVKRQRIARGFYGRVVDGDNVDAVDGLDVVTTLDVDLMDVADRALRRQLTSQNALWGTTIVMDVESGEILAMANLGNTKGGFSEDRFNYAIGSRMEPGSTFKLAALLALLEEGGFSEDHIIDSGDGGVVMVGKARVKDSHKGYSEVDLHTAFAQSLNVYFATAVYETFNKNPNQYIDYLKSINLDKTVGLDAYGEPKPLLPSPGMKGLWTENVTLPYLGYGYAAEVTPLQTATLYNAVANDGKMVAPRLVKEIRRGDKVVERFDSQTLVPKICSDRTLKKVRELLVEVVDSGTANWYLGKFDGMKVGAKTGTAQVAQNGLQYKDGYYLGSMVGYMPAHKPRYTILTAVYTRLGRGRTIYGAGLAGPVVRDVMRYLYNRDQEWLAPIDTIKSRNYPTRIKGGEISAVKSVTSKLSPSAAKSDSNKGWGTTSVAHDSKVTIESVAESANEMPNVVGMGLKDAMFLLESRGLRVSFSGSGRVVSQSIRSGQKISRGGYVSITLK